MKATANHRLMNEDELIVQLNETPGFWEQATEENFDLQDYAVVQDFTHEEPS